jgi:hypothetical protein
MPLKSSTPVCDAHAPQFCPAHALGSAASLQNVLTHSTSPAQSGFAKHVSSAEQHEPCMHVSQVGSPKPTAVQLCM